MVPLSNAMVRTGQRVKLECKANEDPIPELIWTHDGKLIEENKYHKVKNIKIRYDFLNIYNIT